MSTLLLDPAELSYLLQTMHAQSAIGVDNAALFPKTGAKNEALLKKGRELLEQHGWLEPAQDSEKMSLNPALSYLVTIIAAPDTVILTLRQEQEVTYQLVTHYLADKVIVEQMQTSDGAYQLGFVESLTTAVSRIHGALQLKEISVDPTSEKLFLSSEIYKEVKGLIGVGSLETAKSMLKKEGFVNTLADSFVATLQQPTNEDVVIILRQGSEQFVVKHNLAIIQSRQASWLIQMSGPDDPQVCLTMYTPKRFIDTLTRYLEAYTFNEK